MSDTKWINWTWSNPVDADFNYNNIYIDGKFKKNQSQNYYNLTGLSQNTQRTISIRTVDTSKNENLFWTNNTATTDVDNTPPGPVSGLTATLGTTRIDWRWTNPSDDDFSYVMVYLNGVFKTKITQDYYNTTGLRTNTSYELSLVTSDTSNNIGTNWVNRTETTLE